MWYQYIKIVVTQACCQNSDITHPTLQMIKTLPKLRFFNDKKDVFWMGFGMVCCGGRKRARSAARGSAAGERANLNNLYGLVPPPGRRRLFRPRPDKGRRVSWTLFVNWFTWLIFRTVFWHKFRAGPPYNDQKWEPIYLFFLSAKIRAQYIYFATIFFNILGSDFVTIFGPRPYR